MNIDTEDNVENIDKDEEKADNKKKKQKIEIT